MALDARVTEVLSYFTAHNADLVAHTGEAWCEVEILKMLVDGSGGGLGAIGLLGNSYLRKMQALGPPNVPNRTKCYQYTHKIFFASNFGRINIGGITKSAWTSHLDALVPQYLNDPDLLGELLMVSKCLDYTSATLTSALATFIAAWTAAPREPFANNYHLVLVGGFVFKMLLS